MMREKIFDYLDGNLPPDERERLERALIADPELQREFISARRIHRGLARLESGDPLPEKAGAKGRAIAAAAAALVALNVAIGLFFIFRANRVPNQVQQEHNAALRQQLQHALEKSAEAAFPTPSIGVAQIALRVPRDRQEAAAQTIIAVAAKNGGSATKGLPNDNGFQILAVVPGSAENAFRQTLSSLGDAAEPVASVSPAALPNDMVRFEILLAAPR